MISQAQIQTGLKNIYISPLEKCNLNCQLCYTKKTKNILFQESENSNRQVGDEAILINAQSATQSGTQNPDRKVEGFLSNKKILDFLKRYRQVVNLKSILFCGGEVFTLPNFSELINELARIKIFITLITNGTIDRLAEIKDPQNCQLLVSLDGPKEIHDQNRGQGNFQKSIDFINRALSLGFPVEVMFLVTPKSYKYIDCFSLPVKINYITQKTNFFNPKLKRLGLIPKQIINIKTNYPSIPLRDFGCFQLSLLSDGLIYGCCESPTPIAKMTDSAEKIIENFKKTLAICQKCGRCCGCCRPNFLCGYIKELGQDECQQVVKLFR